MGRHEGLVGAPPTHRKDPVSPPQLPAEVSRASSQDEGHKDPLAIFPSNNVEAQAGGAFVQDDFPGLPGRTYEGQGDNGVRSSKAGDRLFCAQSSWHIGGAGVTRVQAGVTQPSALWRLINQKRCSGYDMRQHGQTQSMHCEMTHRNTELRGAIRCHEPEGWDQAPPQHGKCAYTPPMNPSNATDPAQLNRSPNFFDNDLILSQLKQSQLPAGKSRKTAWHPKTPVSIFVWEKKTM